MDDTQKIKKLSKAELAAAYIYLRSTRGLKTTKKDAIETIDDVFKMVDELLTHDNVGITLGKTGVLYNGLQKGRLIKHPQDGTPLVVPDLRAIKFKPAPKYKDDLNSQ